MPEKPCTKKGFESPVHCQVKASHYDYEESPSLGKRCVSDNLASLLSHFKFETPAKRPKFMQEENDCLKRAPSLYFNERFDDLTICSSNLTQKSYPVVSSFVGADLRKKFDLASDC